MSSTGPAAAPGPLRPAVHVPVLLDRITALLAPACAREGAVLVDATLGLAGHSLALLTAHPGLRLIGLDRDPEARAEAGRRLAAAGAAGRATLVAAVFDELPDVLDRLGVAEVQAVLFDLGVSSLQLDRPERGFSYAADAPLDMRMDPTGPRTAADVVNTYPPRELARVLRVYGEERFATRIAAAIERERARRPLTTTGRLAELVRDAIPAATRRTGGHPAKRTFQALRIEVNDELGALTRALPAAVDALAVGGRIAVITFHSLEDRIVKQTLVAGATDRTPPDLPVPLPEHGPVLRLLTRGGEAPSEAEVAANPRAASARVRAAERIRRAACASPRLVPPAPRTAVRRATAARSRSAPTAPGWSAAPAGPPHPGRCPPCTAPPPPGTPREGRSAAVRCGPTSGW
jgi:16S rRNA (cytosine1402-N4)-methyltransferase